MYYFQHFSCNSTLYHALLRAQTRVAVMPVANGSNGFGPKMWVRSVRTFRSQDRSVPRRIRLGPKCLETLVVSTCGLVNYLRM